MAISMGGGPTGPQMNVTPMIDVLLVLIIIFMVVSQSLKTKWGGGADSAASETRLAAAAGRSHDRDPSRMGAGRSQHRCSRSIRISVKMEDLAPRLQEIFKMRAEKVAFVQGDGDVDFEPVAQVIGAAHEAGIDRVGLLTRPVGDMPARV